MNAQLKPVTNDIIPVPEMVCSPLVYAAISKVMGDVGKIGISKDRKNEQQGYKFRGIDDVFNALSPLLAAAGLCVLPRVTSREITERQTKSGGVLFYVVLNVEYDFVCAQDGSKHTAVVVGEAMDSGDKATNKAMSAAYKYACMQVFCIPTEGDNDADSTTHEVKAGVTLEEARALAVDMLACLTADVSEEVMALAVLDLHDRVKAIHDLYSAASDQLKPSVRAAWKNLVAIGKKMAADEKAITNAGRG